MRYVVAILFAIAGAALAFALVSGPIADWTVAQRTFDNSDDVENLHQMAFMGVNLAGLIIGWTIGWALGAKLGDDDDVEAK